MIVKFYFGIPEGWFLSRMRIMCVTERLMIKFMHVCVIAAQKHPCSILRAMKTKLCVVTGAIHVTWCLVAQIKLSESSNPAIMEDQEVKHLMMSYD